ncbi:DUF6795 domain-containing protein [Microbulbifer hainanensis]|uniref:DUF6795 domain-containing protein n=1 Tax=Microbulbifer hainanensis TaxID=2735675 RepID=UPI001867B9AA|nr:DUF6795 domain-containing protein [Microbulbifer hainanensis]
MSIFDTRNAFLFSPSKIKITQNGETFKNLKVIRRWEWKDGLEEDSSYTDEHGFVEFDGIRDPGISQILPIQFFVAQQLAIVINGDEEILWENAKMSPAKNSELDGQPLILNCDINEKEKTYRIGGSDLYTRCRWKTGEKI